MLKFVFLTIHKELGTLECSKHRTISNISQVSEVFLRVSHGQNEGKDNKTDCRRTVGKGTTNAIFVLWMLAETAIQVQKDLCLCL